MNDAPAPAYFMVQIKAHNHEETMQKYGIFAIAMLEKFGGQMIAGSHSARILEGTWDGNWAAILRFPSMVMAEAWYDSQEYQPLKELRINVLTESGRVLLLEGV